MTKYDKARIYILHCIVQRLSEKESLAYLKGHDILIAPQTLYLWKKKLLEERFSRMNTIADTGYIDYHLDAIDTLEWAKKEIVTNYHREQDPYKKVEIIVQLVNLLPFFSEYIAETKEVIERKKILLKSSEPETAVKITD